MSQANEQDIAIFPLNTVLFPGGKLPLRIFEARYLDMISDCLKTNRPFVVVAIKSGSEVGPGASFCDVGTCANIIDWDQHDNGLLHVDTNGGERVKVMNHRVQTDGLIRAEVQPSPIPAAAVPPEHAGLIELLKHLYVENPEIKPAEPWLMDDAAWLAYRFAELMPLPGAARVALLQLDSALEALNTIAAYLKPGDSGEQASQPHH